MKNTFLVFIGLCLILAQPLRAQDDEVGIDERTITTAVPFLLIAGDARGASMGDMGVATGPDAFSQQYNPAKYAFAESGQSIGLSYTPYLREIVTDINLGQLSYYNRFNEKSAFAASLRYFSLGEIFLRESFESEERPVEPNEFAFDVTYALKLSERFSMGVTGRMIYSNLRIPSGPGSEDSTPAVTLGVDVSGYYQSEEIVFNNFDGRIRGGFNISNIGPRLSYDDSGQESYLPTNLRLGGGFDFILDASNKIGAFAEINKLLVPTPQDFNNDGVLDSTDAEEYYDINEFSAIITSWGDAPGGFSEELKEITWALGAEYTYENSFSLRAGYFNEAEDKGFRKYLTVGAGFRYTSIKIDMSYLFNTAPAVVNPLEGTLRFSLSFDFGQTYDEY
ncbi:type IX secretion system outer membrane channel protein PorV [Gangjinia marincola]|uniref:Type IX secretion system outer membrane channel protein PorV n=1 Tax=Gangjinia marincola TaxID=578463 RepID=A0ABN1MK23_9FLAO